MTNEVILMSHGLMAKEILNSAQMILGDQINYPVVSMTPDDGIEGTFNKLDKIIGTLNDAKNCDFSRSDGWDSSKYCHDASK